MAKLTPQDIVSAGVLVIMTVKEGQLNEESEKRIGGWNLRSGTYLVTCDLSSDAARKKVGLPLEHFARDTQLMLNSPEAEKSLVAESLKFLFFSSIGSMPRATPLHEGSNKQFPVTPSTPLTRASTTGFSVTPPTPLTGISGDSSVTNLPPVPEKSTEEPLKKEPEGTTLGS
jgi:hypothetical protein